MAGEVTRIQVADLIAEGKLIINDGYRAKNSELSRDGLPFARAQNINDGFRFDAADRFPEEQLDRVGAKISREGDVVFTSKGTVGRFAFVRSDTPRFVYSPQLCFWRSVDSDRIDPGWLFYWMQSREFLVQYRGVAGQTDMAEYVSLRDQRRMSIMLPPIEEQRAIARILGALDDKIELNRRMNETLEALAQAIFKSWFVDFDPVRAKAEGQDPGLSKHIADLFPDRFEDSELGEIPAGWNVMPIGEAVRVVGGGTPSTKEPAFWEDGIHCWATPKDLSKLQDPILLDTERKVTDAGLTKISSGLLPVGTVLLSSRAPVGYLAIARVPVSVNQGFIAMVCEGRLTNHYVLHWALNNMDQIEGRASGTTFQEISKKNFRPMLALVPTNGTLTVFEEQMSALYDKITTNLQQSCALAALRDALLPKLISGDLRVQDGGRTIGEVMP